jgi:branched-chain amino acid transport system ATP-binding protein
MSRLLEVAGISRAFGGLKAVDDISFSVGDKEILGIIGPNGAGKTTAINLVSGVIKPTAGKVTLDGQDVTGAAPHKLVARGLVRTFQNTTVYAARTVRENVYRGAFHRAWPGLMATFFDIGAAKRRRAEANRAVDEVLDWLDLVRVQDSAASSLPYGYQKVLGMAIGLAAGPRLIMLDEPVAGLSAEETDHVRDTVQRVRSRGIAVVVIDHNMRFMSGLCDRALVMVQGRELAHGTPAEVLANPAVIEAYLGKGHAYAGRR